MDWLAWNKKNDGGAADDDIEKGDGGTIVNGDANTTGSATMKRNGSEIITKDSGTISKGGGSRGGSGNGSIKGNGSKIVEEGGDNIINTEDGDSPAIEVDYDDYDLKGRPSSHQSSVKVDDIDNDVYNKIPTVGGYLDGDFSSGKVLNVELPFKCYEMAYCYNLEGTECLLVAGTEKNLIFYDATTENEYRIIYSTPIPNMISALKWIRVEDTKKMFLATGDSHGLVTLYEVTINDLGSHGPSMLFQHTIGATQIRSLDAQYSQYGGLDLLLLTVGSKNGEITTFSFENEKTLHKQTTLRVPSVDEDQNENEEENENEDKDTSKAIGILGLAMETEQGVLAATTSDGQIVVYSMAHALFKSSSMLLFSTQRFGSVRAVAFSPDAALLAAGGYDKTLSLICTQKWAVIRELSLQGTVTAISFDPNNRYLGVGCRDNTFTLFDTSTYVAVKVFSAYAWVTSISWKDPDVVAIRSDNNGLSVFDLTSIRKTKTCLSGTKNSVSVSWHATGQYLARADGSSVSIVDTLQMNDTDKTCDTLATFLVNQSGSPIIKVAFCPAPEKNNWIATIDGDGLLVILEFCYSPRFMTGLKLVRRVKVEADLKALKWSPDGSMLLLGGGNRRLHVLETNTWKSKVTPLIYQGKIWDIDFVEEAMITRKDSDEAASRPHIGVALGDNRSIILDHQFHPVLQIARSRPCRCLAFHPLLPLVAIGDGAGFVCIVDYDSGEFRCDVDVKGKVNDINFSPAGNFLVISTDACKFLVYEASSCQPLQEIKARGFALCASFSPNGKYISLGNECGTYELLRLGPLLDLSMIPLTFDPESSSLFNEILFRSGDCPSFLQRLMIRGGSDNLERISATLHNHSNAIYTINRMNAESCFDTAFSANRPGLLKMMVLCLVDGTLIPEDDREKSFLSTNIPSRCRDVLLNMMRTYPPNCIVEILNAIQFVKVPFTEPIYVEHSARVHCASKSYADPWSTLNHADYKLSPRSLSSKLLSKKGSTRTPVVLPLPWLGEMSFLSSLLVYAPIEAFDNNALALVLKVMWEDHIKKFYYFDCLLFVTFYACWIAVVENVVSASEDDDDNLEKAKRILYVVVTFNSLFATKEVVEGRFGTRSTYWISSWNLLDLASIVFVYVYSLRLFTTNEGKGALAIITTLLLTIKLLSYFRGFEETGWIVSVLSSTWRDVRGFLVVLAVILVGFSVAFRTVFSDIGDNSFGSMRRSLLSTFQLAVTGSYDSEIFFETPYTVVSVLTFVLAVICILVVALNSLIAILADSYARAQQDAVANRRRQQAALIVEYMGLLPSQKREQIEESTKWFHALLEVDSDGELRTNTANWAGSLQAVKREIAKLSEENRKMNERAMDNLRADFEKEVAYFKYEMLSSVEEIGEDVRYFTKKAHSQGLLKSDANVVKTVRSAKWKRKFLSKMKEE